MMEKGAPPELAEFDSISPSCDACGQENVGMGERVFMLVPGMMFPSMEFDAPIFVVDPDAKITIVQLPNGSLGLFTDNQIVKYAHEDCYTERCEDHLYDLEHHDDDEDEDE